MAMLRQLLVGITADWEDVEVAVTKTPEIRGWSKNPMKGQLQSPQPETGRGEAAGPAAIGIGWVGILRTV
jgi:hypothetical protein